MLEQLRLGLALPDVLPALLAGVVFAAVAFLPLARRYGRSPLWTLLALLAIAPILAFTVPPRASTVPAGAVARLIGFVGLFLNPWNVAHEIAVAGSDDERVANLLLYVPAGFFATLATRRPVRIALAGVSTPFLIESWQAVSGSRIAAASDWLHNSAGALLGVLVAAVLLPLTRSYRRRAKGRAERYEYAGSPGR
jgi:glycopeptide antibiotics resistance protein